MRVATDQRESTDDRRLPTEPPPRLGGTDLFRGAMVILAAVIIGGLVLSRGIDDDAGDASSEAGGAEVDPAAGATTDTTLADGQAATETDPATNASTDPAADTDPLTGAATGTDGATTPTVPAADTTDDSMADTTDTTDTPLDTVRPPSEVRTLVLNAGGPQGIAGRATELLQGASYLTSAAKNADVNGPSAVYYTEGYQAEALAVASVFGPDLEAIVQPLDAVSPPTADLQQATVIVVVGNDDAIAVP